VLPAKIGQASLQLFKNSRPCFRAIDEGEVRLDLFV
jgi:hypothetical protein